MKGRFYMIVQTSASPGVNRQHGLEPLGVAGHGAAPPSDVALQHRHQRQHGLGRQPPHRVVNKLKYFCVMITEYFPNVNVTVTSALSSTESRILASLLWRPCTSSWVSASVRGEVAELEPVVDSRDNRSWSGDMYLEIVNLVISPPLANCSRSVCPLVSSCWRREPH